MEFLKIIFIFIITQIIFSPINNRYHLRSKYQDHSNKRFRFIVVFFAVCLVVTGLGIGCLHDEIFIMYHLNKEIVSYIFMAPIVFILLMCIPKVDK